MSVLSLSLVVTQWNAETSICSECLPNPPAWNAHCLDDADHHLGHEHEEEGHEVEGAIRPAMWGEQMYNNITKGCKRLILRNIQEYRC